MALVVDVSVDMDAVPGGPEVVAVVADVVEVDVVVDEVVDPPVVADVLGVAVEEPVVELVPVVPVVVEPPVVDVPPVVVVGGVNVAAQLLTSVPAGHVPPETQLTTPDEVLQYEQP